MLSVKFQDKQSFSMYIIRGKKIQIKLNDSKIVKEVGLPDLQAELTRFNLFQFLI